MGVKQVAVRKTARKRAVAAEAVAEDVAVQVDVADAAIEATVVEPMVVEATPAEPEIPKTPGELMLARLREIPSCSPFGPALDALAEQLRGVKTVRQLLELNLGDTDAAVANIRATLDLMARRNAKALIEAMKKIPPKTTYENFI
jgi:hypothetical protein